MYLLITTFKVNVESLLSVNSTYVTLHLHRWPDGGCPIHYYVIEYRQVGQHTWRVVSSNIRYLSISLSFFCQLPIYLFYLFIYPYYTYISIFFIYFSNHPSISLLLSIYISTNLSFNQ